MYRPEYTSQFKKDYKKCLKRNLPEAEIQEVMTILIEGQKLPAKNRDHTLKGKYSGFGECHIRPDWLLIYLKKEEKTKEQAEVEKIIVFVRAGSHSDLFD